MRPTICVYFSGLFPCCGRIAKKTQHLQDDFRISINELNENRVYRKPSSTRACNHRTDTGENKQ